MATAFIHSGSEYFYRMCRAYFKVHGHTVTDCTVADVAIIDLDHRPLPEVEARILVYISARDYSRCKLPEYALFRLKPVDADALMDRILEMLEQTV